MSLKVYALEECPFSIATVNMLKQINPNIEIITVKRSEKEQVKKLVNHPTFPCTHLVNGNNIINLGGNDSMEYLVGKSSELKKICNSQNNEFKDKLSEISIQTGLSKRILCNFYNALYTN